MDVNRCAYPQYSRNFSETLLRWGQAEWRDIFSLQCLIQSSPIPRQADLGKEVSRGAVLMWRFAGHIASSFGCVCFCFTLWLDQQGLSKVCTFQFSSFFLCGGNLQLLLMTWCDGDHECLDEKPSLVLFPFKLNRCYRTRCVHTWFLAQSGATPPESAESLSRVARFRDHWGRPVLKSPICLIWRRKLKQDCLLECPCLPGWELLFFALGISFKPSLDEKIR